MRARVRTHMSRCRRRDGPPAGRAAGCRAADATDRSDAPAGDPDGGRCTRRARQRRGEGRGGSSLAADGKPRAHRRLLLRVRHAVAQSCARPPADQQRNAELFHGVPSC